MSCAPHILKMANLCHSIFTYVNYSITKTKTKQKEKLGNEEGNEDLKAKAIWTEVI